MNNALARTLVLVGWVATTAWTVGCEENAAQTSAPVPGDEVSTAPEDVADGSVTAEDAATEEDTRDTSEGPDDVPAVPDVVLPTPEVQLEPSAPTTLDDLTAIVNLPAGAEAPDLRFSWRRNGVLTSVTEATVPAAQTARGQEWEVTVQVGAAGPSVTASVVVQNSPPTCVSAQWSLTSPTALESVECGCTEWSDADQDQVTMRCRLGVGAPIDDASPAGSCVLPPGTPKGTELACAAVPFDGFEEGPATDTVFATVANSPPYPPTVSLVPTSANTSTTLTCNVLLALDPDGDDLTAIVGWLVDDVPVDATGVSLVAGSLPGVTAGSTIRCTGVATDGDAQSDPALSPPVTIGNSAPAGGVVTVTPSVATETSILTCNASGAVDPDGDEVSWTYRWTVGGALTAVSVPTLDGQHFDRGQSVSCAARPSDGALTGGWINADSPVVIANSPPALAEASVAPEEAGQNDSFTCSTTGATDADPADTVSVLYAWTVNGAPVDGAETNTLSASGIAPGAEVVCVATPSDGTDSGPPVPSSPVTVVNSPPAAVVTIQPKNPETGDALSCQLVSTQEIDPDGDPVTFEWGWQLDGESYAWTQPVLPASATSSGQSWRCTVIPSDPWDVGAQAVSLPVVIGNSPPVPPTVTVTPSVANGLTELTCLIEGASDPDGDDLTTIIDWRADGLSVGVSEPTYVPFGLANGTGVTCVVEVSDGQSSTGEIESEPATVLNQAPSFEQASITPTDPTTDAVLTCSASGWSDPDGDMPDYEWNWFVSGAKVAVDGPELSGEWFDKGDNVVCRPVPVDEYNSGAGVSSSSVLILNSPPSATVSVEPPTADETTILTCVPVWSDPDDADLPSYTTTWTVNGELVAGQTGMNLGGAYFARDDEVRCQVVPNDGDVDGPPAESAPVTIGNAGPLLVSAAVEPSVPGTLDTVACVPAGFVDPDGDTPSYVYAWYVGGVELPEQTGATLPSTAFSEGQTIRCTVVASDGQGAETDSIESPTVTVANTPPTVDSVSVTPTEGGSTVARVCAAVGLVDPDDGDVASVTSTWLLDGEVVPGAVGSSLTPTGAAPGAELVCRLTPTDGEDVGLPVDSEPIVIGNTAPSLAGATVTPDEPKTTDDLACAGVAPQDVDDDAVTVSYEWLLDGEVVAETAVLPASQTARGDVLLCRATPSDAVESGAPVLAEPVTIENSLPVVALVEMAPSSPTELSGAVCTASGVSDADGDEVTILWSWEIEGEPVVGQTTATLPPGLLEKGQSVRCLATPGDGIGAGVQVAGPLVTVGNAAPVADSAVVTPPSPSTTDVLSCTGGGFVDADGDPEGYNYVWLRDGEVIEGQTQSTLSPLLTGKAESIQCRVFPWDGASEGAPVTSEPVIVLNSPPSVGAPTVMPSVASVVTELTCAAGLATDPDVDPVGLSYTWWVNDEVAEGATLSTWVPSVAARGDAVVCRVTPNDGTVDGAVAVSPPVLIGNAVPVVDTLVIAPAEPNAESELSCVASTSDPDLDPVTVSYSWTSGGEAVGDGATLSEGFARGDEVVCQAVPSDPTGDGEPVTTSIVIGNAPPTVSGVMISPEVPTAATGATCVFGETADADGDTVNTSVQWLVDAMVGPSTVSIPVQKGQTISCTMTPSDATDDGEPVVSVSVVVGNVPPTATSAQVTPNAPDTADDLTCTGLGFADLDGDPEGWTYQWFANGMALDGATDAVLSASATSRDVDYSCVVRPDDGEELGIDRISNVVSVSNSAPAITGAQILPAEPNTTTDLTCSPIGATDLDGDPVTYLATWKKNGADFPWFDPVLPAAAHARGMAFSCELTPTDATDQGLPQVAAEVVIGNAPPQFESVTITPNPPSTCAEVTCAAVVTDPDPADTVETTVTWTVNGESMGNEETLDLVLVPPGTVVECSVAATDSQDDSSIQTAQVVTENEPPSLGLATLNPVHPEPGDVIHCEGELWADDCNVLPNYEFAWYVGGELLEGAFNTIISTAGLPIGAAVYCEILPVDGLDEGEIVASNEIIIGCTETSCDDGDACTIDTCNVETGLCQTAPVDCGDGEPCTDDVCTDGLCTNPPTDCNDGDPCTVDSCGALGCETTPKDCSDNDPCTLDLCEPVTGVCSRPLVDCDDGDVCTQDYCDPTLPVENQCQHVAVAPGVCGQPCTQPVDCTDFNPCTTDACTPEGCVNTPPDCDDGESCTVDTCNPSTGQCESDILDGCFVGCTQDVHCDDGQACTTDACVDGECVATDVPGCVACASDAECPNENLCLVVSCALADGESVGACTSAERVCYDGVNCTFDTCNSNTGCEFKTLAGCEVGCNEDSDCDDGNPCTEDICESDLDACSNTLIDCNDGDPCTLDACSPESGTCVALPWPQCDDDGGDCTTDEKCESVGDPCVIAFCAGPEDDKRCAFEAVTCNDGNTCTEDQCDSEAGGCQFVPVGECSPGDCDYASDCQTGDLCAVAACVDGQCASACVDNEHCDDGEPATLDTCTPDGRCVYEPGQACANDGECWDGNACTRETCDAGTCRSRPVVCEDDRVCTKAYAPCGGEPDAITTARALLGCDPETGQVPACDPSAGCYLLPALNCGGAWVPGEEPLEYPCTGDEDCDTGQLCQPGTCDEGICRVDIVQCPNPGPDKMSYCDPESGQCEVMDRPGWMGCSSDSECRLVNGAPEAGLDYCSIGYCDVNADEPQCFFVERNCDDQNPCTNDECNPDSGCTFTPIPGCIGCQAPDDCDDLDPCTTDTCDNFQCRYESVPGCTSCQNNTCNVDDGIFVCECPADEVFQCPIPYCQSDAECSDGLTCTLDRCMPWGECQSSPVECLFDESCVFPNGGCVEGFGCASLANSACATSCQFDSDCESGDLCAPGTCVDGTCSLDAVVCDDEDPCTLDICSPGTGACVFVPLPGCVLEPCDEESDTDCDFLGSPGCSPAVCFDGQCTLLPAACDDHDPCTTDSCDLGSGECVFAPIPDCAGCVGDADCSDGNACSADACVEGECEFTPIDGCQPCETDSDCPISEDSCAPIVCNGGSGKCESVPVADCKVCDATKPLDVQAEECNDGDQCTVDYCDSATDQCTYVLEVALPGCAPILCESSWECPQQDNCRIEFCDFTLPEPACDHVRIDEEQYPECPVSCATDLDCYDGDPCTLDRCDPLAGECEWHNKDCVDELGCTTDHQCTEGGCQFAAVLDCNEDCNDDTDCATNDPCTSGVCVPDGGGGTRCQIDVLECDDGDQTTFDWCHQGVCESEPILGGAMDSACASDADCEAGYMAAYGMLDACTRLQCADGYCVGAPVECDDSNPCTVDTCDGGSGCQFAVQAGCTLGCNSNEDCDDDDALTEDVCDFGVCRNYFGGLPCQSDIDCKDENACTYEYCNEQDRCESRPILCFDGLDCTKDLAPCGGHPADIASELAYETCDPLNGQPVACDPNAGCYQMPLETCGNGDAGVSCMSDDDCSTDQACWPSICTESGVCASGPAVCPASGPDKKPFCEPTTGQCQEDDVPGWVQCEDHDDCRFVADDFIAGRHRCEIAFCNKADNNPLTRQCMFFTRHCDDLNPCTADTCDPEQGCVFTPIPGCQGCTQNDHCDDWSPCTVDTCDVATHRCQHQQVPGCARCTVGTADALCNDFDDCTMDLCDESLAPQNNTAGVCVHVPYPQEEKPGCYQACATDQECVDEDPCTIDRCDPDTLFCTHEAPDCVDGNPCTEDPLGCFQDYPGCQYTLNGSCGGQGCAGDEECDSGNPCILGTCEMGTCDFSPVFCDDGDPTTRDACDPYTGQCEFTPDPTGGPTSCEETPFGVTPPACDDQNPCTIDICVGAPGFTCLYAPVACDDFDPCTQDSCNPAGQGCEFASIPGCTGCSSDDDCDDGNACTTDTCDNGQCDSVPLGLGGQPAPPYCPTNP